MTHVTEKAGAAHGSAASQPACADDGRAGDKRVALLTTTDQILSSASNALMVFAIAQVSSAGQFGVTALMVTIVTVWTGFSRGALGTPVLLTSNLSKKAISIESGYAVSWALATGLLAGALTIVCGVVFGEFWIGVAFGLSLPCVLAQDVLRVSAISLGKPGRAVVADALWVAWMLAVFVANISGVHALRAATTIVVWGVGAVVSGVLLAFWSQTFPRCHRIFDWWRRYAPARIRFGSSYAVSQVGAVLVTLSAVTIVGGTAAAAIRGATTLFGPISVLISAMPMVFVPHTARNRHSLRRQWRLLALASTVTSGLTLVATACLTALPDTLGSAFLGETWTKALPLIPYIGIEWAAVCWLVSVYVFFQSQGASKTVATLNILHVGVQLAACIAAGLLFRDAIAIGIALAGSGIGLAILGMLWVWVWVRGTDVSQGGRHGAQLRAPVR